MVGPVRIIPDFGSKPVPTRSLFTELPPFRQGVRSAYWSSNQLRDHRTLGYTYPELVHRDSDTEEELSKHINARADLLYGTMPTSTSWAIVIEARKYQRGGSFSVFFFWGDIEEEEDVKQWRASKALLGTFEVFANASAGHTRGTGSQQNVEIMVEGRVYLDDVLQGVEPKDVRSAIDKNLSWKAVQVTRVSAGGLLRRCR